MGRRPPHKANPPPKPQAKIQQPQPPTKTSPTSLQSISPSSDDLAWSLYHSGALFEFNLKPQEAVACWELSEQSDLEHAPTRFKLADAYLRGYHYPQDSEKALHYFQLAAAQGHDESAAHIALFHLAGLHFPQSALEAYNILHARAEAGCAASMYWLSKTHMAGIKEALELAGLSHGLLPDLSDEDSDATIIMDSVQFAQSDQHAIELLQKAAELGFHQAQKKISSCYFFGAHVEVSLDQSIHWATQHALSNPLEQYNRDKANGSNAEIDAALDYIHGTNGSLVDYQAAAELLDSAADKGYAKASYLLALLYRHGKIESKQGADLISYVQAAVRGSPKGQCRIGLEYYSSQNYESAAHWLQLAADQNDYQAIASLAEMYDNGKYFTQDADKAVELYLKAAQGRHVHAQLNLAYSYYCGSGIEQSYSSAAEWFTKVINTPAPPDGTDDITQLLDAQQTEAFQENVNSAYFWLGDMHQSGYHFPQNDLMAIQHFTIGAETGDASCQNALGDTYAIYLPQNMRDDTAAVKWFTMAAHQGHEPSQHSLGVHLLNGSIEATYALGKLHYKVIIPTSSPKIPKRAFV